MSYRVRILPRAERDIESIFEYIAERSPDGAKRWWSELKTASERAANRPIQFPLAPENSLSELELRHFIFKTRHGRAYRAVFAVIDNEVCILRVRGPGQPPLSNDEL